MVAIEYPVTKRFVGGMRAEMLISQDIVGQESMRKERSGKQGQTLLVSKDLYIISTAMLIYISMVGSSNT